MKHWLCLASAAGLLVPLAGQAEQTLSQGADRRTTDARLNFELSIDRVIFLRVGAGAAQPGTGSGTGPAASATVSDVTLSVGLAPGAKAPVYLPSNAVALPVEVRSNAGQIRLSAQSSGPLRHGADQIPMSQLSLSSDSAALPAPPLPDSGLGASVNVSLGGSGTAAAPTLLTDRRANWTFRYTPVTSPTAGVYTGRITFSAATP